MSIYEVRYFDLGISSALQRLHFRSASKDHHFSLVNPVTTRTMYPTRMLRMQPSRAFGLQATRPLFRPVPVSCSAPPLGAND